MKNILSGKAEFRFLVLVLAFSLIPNLIAYLAIFELKASTVLVNELSAISVNIQEITKKELFGQADDELLEETAYLIEKYKNNSDADFYKDASLIDIKWSEIENEIEKQREGGDSERLYELSDELFLITRNASEKIGTRMSDESEKSLIVLMGMSCTATVLFFGFAFYYSHSIHLKSQAGELRKTAYTDPLTGLANRKSCEDKLESVKKNPENTRITVLLFDIDNMNDVNRKNGFVYGNGIIRNFGKILEMSLSDFGFVGRYCGDTFLGILIDKSEAEIGKIATRVNEQVIKFNLHQLDESKKIKFSVGYYTDILKNKSPAEILETADKSMNLKKENSKTVISW